MRGMRSFAAAGVALAAAAFIGCSESMGSGGNCGSGTAPSVAGTYKLARYTLGSNTVDTLQGATGQLRFYAANYAFNATIPGTGAIADSGSYTITGIRCMSEVSVLNPGTSTGEFTLSGTTPGSVFTFAGTNTIVGPVGFVAVKQ